MTSMPASRNARAITLAPRSWPSRPGLAISTRIFFSGIFAVSSSSGSLPQILNRHHNHCRYHQIDAQEAYKTKEPAVAALRIVGPRSKDAFVALKIAPMTEREL